MTSERSFHLAQLNIAQMLYPRDDPRMKGFFDMIPQINELAESSDGFVWRLQDEDGDATTIRVFDDEMLLVNMSVWETIEHLKHFVYKTAHAEVMRQRKLWFESMKQTYQVLWWIPVGNEPTTADAVARLDLLRENGPTPQAFSFKQTFSPPKTATG